MKTMTMKTTGALLLSLFLFAGCARKNDSASLTQSRLGARGDSPAASGPIAVDVIALSQPVATGSGTTVRSTLQVGSAVQDMTSTHYDWMSGGSAYSGGQTSISGYNIYVTSYCRDNSCRRYYVLVDVFNGSTKVMQYGLKYDFDSTGNRFYTTRDSSRLFQSYGDFLNYIDNPANFQ